MLAQPKDDSNTREQSVQSEVYQYKEKKKLRQAFGWNQEETRTMHTDFMVKLQEIYSLITAVRRNNLHGIFSWSHHFGLKIYSVSSIIYLFHLKYLQVF